MSKFIKEYKKIIEDNGFHLLELKENFQKIISNESNTEYTHLPDSCSVEDYSRMIFENTGKREIICESKLSRLWTHIEEGTPFAILSWQRGGMNIKSKSNPNPKKTKLAAFQLLKEELRRMGYGYIEILGGYVERSQGDLPPVDVVDELSVCIPNITLDEALKLGQVDLGFGPQDTILYSDGEKISFHNTDPKNGNIGDVTLRFKYGKGKEALPMGKDAVKEYFSQLKKGSHSGKKFAFVAEDYTFKLLELKDRKTPRKSGYGWWANFGMRIL